MYICYAYISFESKIYNILHGICMTSKDANSKLTGLLHSLPIPNRPWQSIGLDFMGPLPKSNNVDYQLVVIDQLTSQVCFVPTTMTVTARGIAWLILKEVMRLHGIQNP